MQNYLFALTSITYAMKAQNLLRSLGYKCEIQRTPKDLGTGCGYSIKVYGDLADISRLLLVASIKVNGTIEIGGNSD